MAKWIGIILLVIVAMVILPVGYYWITYIDKTVTDGEAYGFSIGSSKISVYRNIPRNIYDMSVTRNVFFTTIKVTEELADKLGSVTDSELLIQTRFHLDSFGFYEKKDLWLIYLEGGYSNFILFQFCDDKLCMIRRHRQYIELP